MQLLRRDAVHLAPVHRAPARERLAAQEQVLRDGQRRDGAQFLVDHADAVLQRFAGPVHLDRFAIEDVSAVVLGVDAREDAHQRAFACAVFADQRVHFPFAQIKIDMVQGLDGAEVLRNILEFKNRCVAHRTTLSTWLY